MEVIVLLLFVSFILAACGVAFFAWNHRGGNHEHGARLSLLPLDLDETQPTMNARRTREHDE